MYVNRYKIHIHKSGAKKCQNIEHVRDKLTLHFATKSSFGRLSFYCDIFGHNFIKIAVKTFWRVKKRSELSKIFKKKPKKWVFALPHLLFVWLRRNTDRYTILVWYSFVRSTFHLFMFVFSCTTILLPIHLLSDAN